MLVLLRESNDKSRRAKGYLITAAYVFEGVPHLVVEKKAENDGAQE